MALLVCPLCSVPHSAGALEQHLRLELRYAPLLCRRCPAAFTGLAQLRHHYAGPFPAHPGLALAYLEEKEPEVEARLKGLLEAAGEALGEVECRESCECCRKRRCRGGSEADPAQAGRGSEDQAKGERETTDLAASFELAEEDEASVQELGVEDSEAEDDGTGDQWQQPTPEASHRVSQPKLALGTRSQSQPNVDSSELEERSPRTADSATPTAQPPPFPTSVLPATPASMPPPSPLFLSTSKRPMARGHASVSKAARSSSPAAVEERSLGNVSLSDESGSVKEENTNREAADQMDVSQRSNCRRCSAAVARRDFRRHAMGHAQRRPFVCNHCTQEATFRSQMQKHLSVYHPEYAEDFEAAVSTSEVGEELERLLRACFGDDVEAKVVYQTLHCRPCSKSVPRPHAKEHAAKHHLRRPLRICRLCGFKSNNFFVSQMRRHTRLHHEVEVSEESCEEHIAELLPEIKRLVGEVFGTI